MQLYWLPQSPTQIEYVVPRRRVIIDHGLSGHELRPTGKWRIKKIRPGQHLLEIQHRGTFAPRWVSENTIKYA